MSSTQDFNIDWFYCFHSSRSICKSWGPQQVRESSQKGKNPSGWYTAAQESHCSPARNALLLVLHGRSYSMRACFSALSYSSKIFCTYKHIKQCWHRLQEYQLCQKLQFLHDGKVQIHKWWNVMLLLYRFRSKLNIWPYIGSSAYAWEIITLSFTSCAMADSFFCILLNNIMNVNGSIFFLLELLISAK